VLALEAVLGGAPITKLALYEPPFIVTNDTDPMPADYPDRLEPSSPPTGVTRCSNCS
jgi:hypothetical protein